MLSVRALVFDYSNIIHFYSKVNDKVRSAGFEPAPSASSFIAFGPR